MKGNIVTGGKVSTTRHLVVVVGIRGGGESQGFVVLVCLFPNVWMLLAEPADQRQSSLSLPSI